MTVFASLAAYLARFRAPPGNTRIAPAGRRPLKERVISNRLVSRRAARAGESRPASLGDEVRRTALTAPHRAAAAVLARCPGSVGVLSSVIAVRRGFTEALSALCRRFVGALLAAIFLLAAPSSAQQPDDGSVIGLPFMPGATVPFEVPPLSLPTGFVTEGASLNVTVIAPEDGVALAVNPAAIAPESLDVDDVTVAFPTGVNAVDSAPTAAIMVGFEIFNQFASDDPAYLQDGGRQFSVRALVAGVTEENLVAVLTALQLSAAPDYTGPVAVVVAVAESEDATINGGTREGVVSTVRQTVAEQITTLRPGTTVPLGAAVLVDEGIPLNNARFEVRVVTPAAGVALAVNPAAIEPESLDVDGSAVQFNAFLSHAAVINVSGSSFSRPQTSFPAPSFLRDEDRQFLIDALDMDSNNATLIAGAAAVTGALQLVIAHDYAGPVEVAVTLETTTMQQRSTSTYYIVEDAGPVGISIGTPAPGAVLSPASVTTLTAAVRVARDFELRGAAFSFGIVEPAAGAALSFLPAASAPAGLVVGDRTVQISTAGINVDTDDGTGLLRIAAPPSGTGLINGNELAVTLTDAPAAGVRPATAEDLSAVIGALQLTFTDGYTGPVTLRAETVENEEPVLHGDERDSAATEFNYRAALISIDRPAAGTGLAAGAAVRLMARSTDGLPALAGARLTVEVTAPASEVTLGFHPAAMVTAANLMNTLVPFGLRFGSGFTHDLRVSDDGIYLAESCDFVTRTVCRPEGGEVVRFDAGGFFSNPGGTLISMTFAEAGDDARPPTAEELGGLLSGLQLTVADDYAGAVGLRVTLDPADDAVVVTADYTAIPAADAGAVLINSPAPGSLLTDELVTLDATVVLREDADFDFAGATLRVEITEPGGGVGLRLHPDAAVGLVAGGRTVRIDPDPLGRGSGVFIDRGDDLGFVRTDDDSGPLLDLNRRVMRITFPERTAAAARVPDTADVGAILDAVQIFAESGSYFGRVTLRVGLDEGGAAPDAFLSDVDYEIPVAVIALTEPVPGTVLLSGTAATTLAGTVAVNDDDFVFDGATFSVMLDAPAPGVTLSLHPDALSDAGLAVGDATVRIDADNGVFIRRADDTDFILVNSALPFFREQLLTGGTLFMVYSPFPVVAIFTVGGELPVAEYLAGTVGAPVPDAADRDPVDNQRAMTAADLGTLLGALRLSVAGSYAGPVSLTVMLAESPLEEIHGNRQEVAVETFDYTVAPATGDAVITVTAPAPGTAIARGASVALAGQVAASDGFDFRGASLTVEVVEPVGGVTLAFGMGRASTVVSGQTLTGLGVVLPQDLFDTFDDGNIQINVRAVEPLSGGGVGFRYHPDIFTDEGSDSGLGNDLRLRLQILSGGSCGLFSVTSFCFFTTFEAGEDSRPNSGTGVVYGLLRNPTNQFLPVNSERLDSLTYETTEAFNSFTMRPGVGELNAYLGFAAQIVIADDFSGPVEVETVLSPRSGTAVPSSSFRTFFRVAGASEVVGDRAVQLDEGDLEIDELRGRGFVAINAADAPVADDLQRAASFTVTFADEEADGRRPATAADLSAVLSLVQISLDERYIGPIQLRLSVSQDEMRGGRVFSTEVDYTVGVGDDGALIIDEPADGTELAFGSDTAFTARVLTGDGFDYAGATLTVEQTSSPGVTLDLARAVRGDAGLEAGDRRVRVGAADAVAIDAGAGFVGISAAATPRLVVHGRFIATAAEVSAAQFESLGGLDRAAVAAALGGDAAVNTFFGTDEEIYALVISNSSAVSYRANLATLEGDGFEAPNGRRVRVGGSPLQVRIDRGDGNGFVARGQLAISNPFSTGTAGSVAFTGFVSNPPDFDDLSATFSALEIRVDPGTATTLTATFGTGGFTQGGGGGTSIVNEVFSDVRNVGGEIPLVGDVVAVRIEGEEGGVIIHVDAGDAGFVEINDGDRLLRQTSDTPVLTFEVLTFDVAAVERTSLQFIFATAADAEASDDVRLATDADVVALLRALRLTLSDDYIGTITFRATLADASGGTALTDAVNYASPSEGLLLDAPATGTVLGQSVPVPLVVRVLGTGYSEARLVVEVTEPASGVTLSLDPRFVADFSSGVPISGGRRLFRSIDSSGGRGIQIVGPGGDIITLAFSGGLLINEAQTRFEALFVPEMQDPNFRPPTAAEIGEILSVISLLPAADYLGPAGLRIALENRDPETAVEGRYEVTVSGLGTVSIDAPADEPLTFTRDTTLSARVLVGGDFVFNFATLIVEVTAPQDGVTLRFDPGAIAPESLSVDDREIRIIGSRGQGGIRTDRDDGDGFLRVDRNLGGDSLVMDFGRRVEVAFVGEADPVGETRVPDLGDVNAILDALQLAVEDDYTGEVSLRIELQSGRDPQSGDEVGSITATANYAVPAVELSIDAPAPGATLPSAAAQPLGATISANRNFRFEDSLLAVTVTVPAGGDGVTLRFDPDALTPGGLIVGAATVRVDGANLSLDAAGGTDFVQVNNPADGLISANGDAVRVVSRSAGPGGRVITAADMNAIVGALQLVITPGYAGPVALRIDVAESEVPQFFGATREAVAATANYTAELAPGAAFISILAPADGATLTGGSASRVNAALSAHAEFDIIGAALSVAVTTAPPGGAWLQLSPAAIGDTVVRVDRAAVSISNDVTAVGEGFEQINDAAATFFQERRVIVSFAADPEDDSSARTATLADVAAVLNALEIVLADDYAGAVSLQVRLTEAADSGGFTAVATADYTAVAPPAGGLTITAPPAGGELFPGAAALAATVAAGDDFDFDGATLTVEVIEPLTGGAEIAINPATDPATDPPLSVNGRGVRVSQDGVIEIDAGTGFEPISGADGVSAVSILGRFDVPAPSGDLSGLLSSGETRLFPPRLSDSEAVFDEFIFDGLILVVSVTMPTDTDFTLGLDDALFTSEGLDAGGGRRVRAEDMSGGEVMILTDRDDGEGFIQRAVFNNVSTQAELQNVQSFGVTGNANLDLADLDAILSAVRVTADLTYTGPAVVRVDVDDTGGSSVGFSVFYDVVPAADLSMAVEVSPVGGALRVRLSGGVTVVDVAGDGVFVEINDGAVLRRPGGTTLVFTVAEVVEESTLGLRFTFASAADVPAARVALAADVAALFGALQLVLAEGSTGTVALRTTLAESVAADGESLADLVRYTATPARFSFSPGAGAGDGRFVTVGSDGQMSFIDLDLSKMVTLSETFGLGGAVLTVRVDGPGNEGLRLRLRPRALTATGLLVNDRRVLISPTVNSFNRINIDRQDDEGSKLINLPPGDDPLILRPDENVFTATFAEVEDIPGQVQCAVPEDVNAILGTLRVVVPEDYVGPVDLRISLTESNDLVLNGGSRESSAASIRFTASPGPAVTRPVNLVARSTETATRHETAYESVTILGADLDIELSGPRLELQRYADDASSSGEHTVTLTGELLDEYATILVTADDVESQLSSNAGVTIASGEETGIALLFDNPALLDDFSGRALLSFEVSNAEGEGGRRTVRFEIAAVNDPLDFAVPGCGLGSTDGADGTPCGEVLFVVVGTSVRAVEETVDPDVDVLVADVLSASSPDVTFAASDRLPYFLGPNDTIEVTVSADTGAGNPSPEDLASIVRDHEIVIDVINSDGVTLGSTSRESNVLSGSTMLTFTAIGSVLRTDARALMQSIRINVLPGAAPLPRRVTIAVSAHANQDTAALASGERTMAAKTFIIRGDEPPQLEAGGEDDDGDGIGTAVPVLESVLIGADPQNNGVQLFGDDLEITDAEEAAGEHDPAIAMVRVSASTPTSTVGFLAPGVGFQVDAEDGSTSLMLIPNASVRSTFVSTIFTFTSSSLFSLAEVTISIVPGPGMTEQPMTAAQAVRVLQALRFRPAGNTNPPEEIRFTVALIPVSTSGINQNTVTDAKDQPVILENEPGTATLTVTEQTVLENAAGGAFLRIGMADVVELDQIIEIEVSSEIDPSYPRNIFGVNDLFSTPPEFRAVSDRSTSVFVIEFNRGALNSNRYGVIRFTLNVAEREPDGSPIVVGLEPDGASRLAPPLIEGGEFLLRVEPVNDPITTVPEQASIITHSEGDVPIFGTVFTVYEGPPPPDELEENDDVVISNPRVELQRYASTQNAVILTGDLFDRSSVVVLIGSRRLTSANPVTVASGLSLQVTLEGVEDALTEFNGRALLTLDLTDEPGQDGLTLMTSRVITFEINPVNDGVDFAVAGCARGAADDGDPALDGCDGAGMVMLPPGMSLPPVSDVFDPDVHDFDVGAAQVGDQDDVFTLTGNAAPYFRAADAVTVTVAAADPDSLLPAELASIVAHNLITFSGAGTVATESEAMGVGTISRSLNFNANVSAELAAQILAGITLTTTADAEPVLRRVTVETTSQPNDGENGDQGLTATIAKTFTLRGDPLPTVTFGAVEPIGELVLRDAMGVQVFGDALVADANEAAEEAHGAAIALVRVAATVAPDATVIGVLEPGDGFSTGGLADFDFTFSGADVSTATATIARSDGSPMTTAEAEEVLRTLRFATTGTGTGNFDPPDLIRFTVTLTPDDTRPGIIRQNPVEAVKDQPVILYDDPPQVVLMSEPFERTVDEDTPGADPLTMIGTADPRERRQTLAVSIAGRVIDPAYLNNISTADELFAASPQAQIVSTRVASETPAEAIQFSYGALAADRYGAVRFTLEFAETGDFALPSTPHASVTRDYLLVVTPVADPVATVPMEVLTVTHDEGVPVFGSAFASVSDGPGEEDPIIVSNPHLELWRYSDPTKAVSLDGAALDNSGVIIRIGADKEEFRASSTVTVASGQTLAVELEFIDYEFNGRVMLGLSLEDEEGVDGVSLLTRSTITFEIRPVNDGVDFAVPGCGIEQADNGDPGDGCDGALTAAAADENTELRLVPGSGSTLLSNVMDPDVDDLPVLSRLAILSGNFAPYFRAGDAVTVTISRPNGGYAPTAEELQSIAEDNVLAVTGIGNFGTAAMVQDPVQGTVALMLSFNRGVPATNAQAILQSITVTMADDLLPVDRLLTVATTSQPNDGGDGLQDAGNTVTIAKSFTLISDTPPAITFGDAVVSDETTLQTQTPDGGAAVFAGVLIADQNEDPALLREARATDGSGHHGAAIQSIVISRPALRLTTAAGFAFATDGSFDAGAYRLSAVTATGDNAMQTLTRVNISDAAEAMTTAEAAGALAALIFRIGADNQSPPPQVDFEVVLTPAAGTAGAFINPAGARGVQTLTIIGENDPPTYTDPAVTHTVPEDDPISEFTFGTVNPTEPEDQQLTVAILSREVVDVVDGSEVPNNLGSVGAAALFLNIPVIGVELTPPIANGNQQIRLTDLNLAANRYGAVLFTLRVSDTGEPPLSAEGTFTLVVTPVADPVVTTPQNADSITLDEGQADGSGMVFTMVNDGPLEADPVSITGITNFVLHRYGDDANANRMLSGAAALAHVIITFTDMAGNVIAATDADGDLRDADGSLIAAVNSVGNPSMLTIASGEALNLRVMLLPALSDFNGAGTFTLSLQDELGDDGVQQMSERTFTFTINPVNDGVDFEVPGCGHNEFDALATDAPPDEPRERLACGDTAEALMVNAGLGARFITNVIDPDVDDMEVGSATLAGNAGPYFGTGDAVKVTVSAPDNLALFYSLGEDRADRYLGFDNSTELNSIVDDNTFTQGDDPLPPTETSLSYGGDPDPYAVLSVATEVDAATGVAMRSRTLTFVRPAAANVAQGILGGMGIAVADKADLEYSGDRLVTVEMTSSANDGVDGDAGGDAVTTIKTFVLRTDVTGPTLPGGEAALDPRLPPAAVATVPGDRAVTIAQVGNTEAVLMWDPACDRDRLTIDVGAAAGGCMHDNLVYQIEVTDVSGDEDFTQPPQTIENIQLAAMHDNLQDDSSGYALLSLALLNLVADGDPVTSNSRGYRGLSEDDDLQEIGDNVEAGIASTDTTVAVYRITRAQATLIPGRSYQFALSLIGDTAGNGPEGAGPADGSGDYDLPDTVTLSTDLINDGIGIRASVLDELESFVFVSPGGGIGTYCGAVQNSEFDFRNVGDADGDGLSNVEELGLGLECRVGLDGAGMPDDTALRNGGRLTYLGAAAPIRFNPAIFAPGAEEMTFGSARTYVLIPGTGELTGVNLDAATCDDCEELQVYSYNPPTSQSDVNCRNPRDDSPCEAVVSPLGSFLTTLLWTGATTPTGVEARLVRHVYIAPPVGFDVATVRVPPALTEVSLPVSVAVSESALVFSVGALLGTVIDRLPNSGPEPVRLDDPASPLDRNNPGRVVTVTGLDLTSTPRSATVTLESVGGFAFGNVAEREIDGLTVNDLTEPFSLFAIGNANVEIETQNEPMPSDPELDLTMTLAGGGGTSGAQDGTPRVARQTNADDVPLRFNDDNAVAGSTLTIEITSALSAETYTVGAQVLVGPSRASTPLMVCNDLGCVGVLDRTGFSTTEPSTSNVVMVVFEADAQVGDLIEIRVVVTGVDGSGERRMVEGSNFVSVVDDPDVDTDGDGVPNGGPDNHDVQAGSDRVQVVTDPSATELPLPYLEVSGQNAVSPALGGYALSAAVLFTPDAYAALIPDARSTVISVTTPTPPGYAAAGRTGVFDFNVRNVNPGGVVSVRIPLAAMAARGAVLHKYDEGTWNRFTVANADKYYSAPRPCPAIGASRNGNVDDIGWFEASSNSGLQETRHECLLIEITDGGRNDADGVRNGVIHDPSAFGMVGGSSGGGGGTMEPAWLLLLALGLLLSYGFPHALRRRRPSRFIGTP